MPFSQVMPVGMAVRHMVMENSFTLTGGRHLPACLHRYKTLDQGGTNPPGQSPDSYWLPEDQDGDGFIDHIMLYSYLGLPPAAIILLAHCHHFVMPEGNRYDLVMTGAHTAPSDTFYKKSQIWKSISPWFPSPKMHSRKQKEGEQDEAWLRRNTKMFVRTELKNRNMPDPIAIKFLPESDYPYRLKDFPLDRKKGEKIPAAKRGYYLKLVFEAPITAPLSLGFGSHFGLGQFVGVG